MSKKKEIDIIDEDLDIKKAKVKISMWMDGDLLEAIREETRKATGSSKGYQTFLHQKLRDIFLNRDAWDAAKIQEIERRLALLEKAVAGK